MGGTVYGSPDFTSFSTRSLSTLNFQISPSRSSDSGSSCGSSDLPDFIVRWPIQFLLTEQFDSFPDGAVRDDGEITNASLDAGLIGHVRVSYNILTHANTFVSKTLSNHDQLCGAFNYFGTVRFSDGLIILRREPVSDLILYHFFFFSIVISGGRRTPKSSVMAIGPSKRVYMRNVRWLGVGIRPRHRRVRSDWKGYFACRREPKINPKYPKYSLGMSSQTTSRGCRQLTTIIFQRYELAFPSMKHGYLHKCLALFL